MAALSLSGLAVPSTSAQSVTEDTTLSLGYLSYKDHQQGGKGIQVQSPTLYFKAPLGPRTEIEGGFVYDSISGASAFNVAQPKQPGPNIGPTPTNPNATPIVTPTPTPGPLPCRLATIQALSSIQTLTKASTRPVPPPIVVQPSPPPPSNPPSTRPNNPGRTPNSPSGGSSSLPICGSGSYTVAPTLPSPQVIPTPVIPPPAVQPTPTGNPNSGAYSNENEEERDEGEREEEEDTRKFYSEALKSSKLSSADGGRFSDQRTAGDIKVTHFLDSLSLGAGIAYSTENDYDSLSLLFDTRIWTANKNTTFSFGVSTNLDRITSSADPLLSENKTTLDFLVGVTQVLTPNSIVQSNITFNNQDGYLSDPYRDSDNRPRSRQGIAWLTRYNLFIEPADAALHLDYRLYGDSWGILSHMFEMALYQPISSRFMLRPGFRYYTQGAADFYSYDGSPSSISDNFSFDQRLAAYGGITVGLKLIIDLGAGFKSSVGMDYLTQSSDLQLGSRSHETSRDPLDAQFVFVELTKKF